MPQAYELRFEPTPSDSVIDPRDVNKRGYLFLPARSDAPDKCHVVRWDDDANPTVSFPTDPDRYAAAISPGSAESLHADSVMPAASYSGRDFGSYASTRFGVLCSMLHNARTTYDCPWIPEFKNLTDFLSYISPAQLAFSPASDSGGSQHLQYCYIYLGGFTAKITLYCVDVTPPGSSVAPTPTSDAEVNVGYSIDATGDSICQEVALALASLFPNIYVDATSFSGTVFIGNPSQWSSVASLADFVGANSASPELYVSGCNDPFSLGVSLYTSPGWASGYVGDGAVLTLTADDATAYTDVMDSEYLDPGIEITGGAPPSLPLENLSGYWHWQAGDVGGDVSPDYSGNGRDGTTHGGAYSSDGTYGTVWEQDGTSSDYIEVPTAALAAGTQPMTLLALVKPASAAGGYTWAAAFGDSEAFFVGIHGDEAIGGGFTPDFVESSSSPIAADTWHALSITYDGSDLALYVDGTLVASGSASLNHGSATSYIGRQVSFFGEYWLGQIAQVATFDGVALSAGQVAAWAADPFGSLPVETPIAGTCETETECVGDLGISASIDGSCETETECTGELLLTVALVGVIETETECAGTLSISVELEGLCETETECSGALSLAALLGGVCETETECEGELGFALPLAGVCETETECGGELGTLADIVPGPHCIHGADGFPVGMVEGDGFPLGGSAAAPGASGSTLVIEADGFPVGLVEGDGGCCNGICEG